jgi:ArsR family transcriptional regulator
MDAERFVKVQRALGEPKRIEILAAIRRLSCPDGVACSSLHGEMAGSQSTLSHHISELAKAGLIQERKQGKFSMLSVNEETVAEYMNELQRKILGPADT